MASNPARDSIRIRPEFYVEAGRKTIDMSDAAMRHLMFVTAHQTAPEGVNKENLFQGLTAHILEGSGLPELMTNFFILKQALIDIVDAINDPELEPLRKMARDALEAVS